MAACNVTDFGEVEVDITVLVVGEKSIERINGKVFGE